MNLPRGLEGVEVDETAVSLVDGEHGRLSYRGVAIETLVEWPFTRVAYLVLTGTDPDPATLTAFEKSLAAAAPLTDADRRSVEHLATLPMHPMQCCIALSTMLTHKPGTFASFGEAARGLTVAARLPAAIAYLLERRHGIKPRTFESLDPNARFLAAIGAPESLLHAFTVTQILQLEHSFNASTFTARVVASTLAPVENALAAAYAALHGRLHGGADQAALETAHTVGSPNRAASFVDECLATGEKVMGMGHREYRVLDPRARFVKSLARDIAKDTPLAITQATLEAIESSFDARMREKGKHLYANLEFYKGIVYSAVGLPPDFFTAAFAMARTFGYLAHFIESRKDNRLIRPAARYVGVQP